MLKASPLLTSKDEPDFETRKEKSIINRERRGDLLDNFMKDDQSYGYQLKEIFEEFLEQMRIKKPIEEGHKLCKYLDTYYSIIPAFFKFHNYLAQKQKEEQIEFKIIFRTFGVDHEAISNEFMEFLYNKHPIFENNYPIEEYKSEPFTQYGKIMRSLTDQEDIILIFGLKPSKSHKDLFQSIRNTIFNSDSPDSIHSSLLSLLEESGYEDYSPSELKLYRGVNKIQDLFTSFKKPFLCIQDDYEAWEYHDHNDRFSKPLIINSLDKSIHQIMFDDHCSPDEK
mmetsp:Transcript_17977/g.15897  ORF Transcript_17977/g.15897 Transcript_17977/m.15897 type:complete len:282 (+) Transcript_17977:390-1235(+)